MDTKEFLGLLVWLMFQRHDGIVHFKNEQRAKYPGMSHMQVAMEVKSDGVTMFVVEPDKET